MRARNEKLKLVNWVAVCRGTMVDEGTGGRWRFDDEFQPFDYLETWKISTL
jgi:hypothetical protein